MFRYPEQKVFAIDGVKFGGQPGQSVPVLIGTVFYEKHNVLTKDGFDKKKAEELINKQQEASDATRIPCATNVFLSDTKTLAKRIDFVSSSTKGPIFIDLPSSAVRLAALKYVDESGLSKRIIYNSVNMSINKDEITALKNSKIDSALILAYNPTDNSLEGKINVLEKAGAFGKGFLEIAKECELKNILVDAAMMPLYHGAGISLKAIVTLKAKFGLPTGCAIHNAVAAWEWLRKRGKENLKAVDIASNALPVILGADWVLYGPIENASKVFDLSAFAEILSQEAVEGFVDVKKIEL